MSMKKLKKDLKKTNYIQVNVERGYPGIETKAISFEGQKECDIVRKHILRAIEETQRMEKENV